jgi:hypothetical protein
MRLALEFAQAIERSTHPANLPVWVAQMRVFILEDMGELEAARIVLGGLLASGQITDNSERQFLENRLESLSKRAVSSPRQGSIPRPK